MVSRFLLLLMFAGSVGAAELEGVKLDDQVSVDGQQIQLNGIALRTRFVVFKVYVAGLYLPQKTNSAKTAIEVSGAKRMTLVMLRDVSAEQFIESFDLALNNNNSEAQLAAVKAQKDELFAQIRVIGEARTGTQILLDFRPSSGTVLEVGGTARGKPIPGEEFYRAILRSWVGENPSQEDMKKALLGL